MDGCVCVRENISSGFIMTEESKNREQAQMKKAKKETKRVLWNEEKRLRQKEDEREIEEQMEISFT